MSEPKWKFETSPDLEVTRNTNDWVALKTSCDCGDDKHGITLFIDREIEDVSLTFYANLTWSSHWVGRDFKEHRWEYRQIKKWKVIEKLKLVNVIEKIQYCDFKLVRMWRRIKCALRVLFIGEIELEHDFIFRDKQHIESLRDGFTSAIEKLESIKK